MPRGLIRLWVLRARSFSVTPAATPMARSTMTPMIFLGFLSSQFLRFGVLSIGYGGEGNSQNLVGP